MLTDIQIAQNAKMKHIGEIAAGLGLDENSIDFYGKYKAKIDLGVLENLKDEKDGKLILVTAVTKECPERRQFLRTLTIR